jgi:ribosomal protein S14
LRYTLPKVKRTEEATHCKRCGDELTKSNRYVYLGNVRLKCKVCLREIANKHNEKRRKALKGSKIW